MYFHEDRDLFSETIETIHEETGVEKSIIEKDYYVTLILRQLHQKQPDCVFKGGTSLSKCFKVINRFSEDIDITFTEHLGAGKRKKLKYDVIQKISEELKLPITNWSEIESDRDVNCYIFSYNPASEYDSSKILPEVKLETALLSYSFPTEMKIVSNYVTDFLVKDNQEIISKYNLDDFEMQVQSLNRTFVDKVFALCDYYMANKSLRLSRHLYDLYKLRNFVPLDENLLKLTNDVRIHRQNLKVCPSASADVDIKSLAKEFCKNDFYKDDYEKVTRHFIYDMVSYSDVVENFLEVVDLLFR